MNRTAATTAFDTGSSSRVVEVHGYTVRWGVRVVDVTTAGLTPGSRDIRMSIPVTDVYVVTQPGYRPATWAEERAWHAGYNTADARETEHGLMIRDDES